MFYWRRLALVALTLAAAFVATPTANANPHRGGYYRPYYPGYGYYRPYYPVYGYGYGNGYPYGNVVVVPPPVVVVRPYVPGPPLPPPSFVTVPPPGAGQLPVPTIPPQNFVPVPR